MVALLETQTGGNRLAKLEEHVQACASCRRKVDGLRDMFHALREPDEALVQVDLTANIHRALHQRKPRQPPRALFIATAAGLLIGVGTTTFLLRNREVDTFRAKGAATDVQTWTGFSAYRVIDESRAIGLGDSMSPADTLAFTYSNSGAQPFSYLMIFGVDSQGEVRWYYPAYDGDSDPESVRIDPEARHRALPQRIRHGLPLGRLTLHGLFSRKPLRVSSVEAAVTAVAESNAWRASEPDLLPLSDCTQQTLTTWVR
jgi:hypothetical protein